MEKEKDFLKRKERFEKDLLGLYKKYSVEMYAANAVLPNQEVLPMIKIIDRKDADNTKK